MISVTRLADLLDFGQLFKAFLGNFCKGVKIYHFSTQIIFGQLLYRLGDFSDHTNYDDVDDQLVSDDDNECIVTRND